MAETSRDDPPGSAPAPRSAGPTGEGEHVVRQGEDLHSVAWRYGVDPTQLWDHQGNAALRDKRKAGVLLPGDLVTIPTPLERPSFSVSPGGTHRFKAMVPRHELRVALEQGGEPRADIPFTAEVDGVTHELTTDGQGNVVVPVGPSTRFVTLTLHEEDEDGNIHDENMRIELGGLDPNDNLTGVQARLRNLGHSPGAVDGEFGPRTKRAIEDFQRDEGLEITGQLDDDTRSRLAEQHEH
jgi:hypothetical protein